MADRMDIRLPFLHLTGKEEAIQYLKNGSAQEDFEPLDQDVYLNMAEVLRIDNFNDTAVKHIYMKNGDFYRIKNGFTTKCL